MLKIESHDRDDGEEGTLPALYMKYDLFLKRGNWMNPINKRRIEVCILLSLVTAGIYAIYWMYLLLKNVKAVKHDSSSCTKEMLCILFVPFYALYWWYTRGNDVKRLLEEQDCRIFATGTLYLVLSIVGLSIVAMAIMQNDFNSLPAVVTKSQQQGTGRNLKKIPIYLALTIWAVIVLFPFYWMVMTSFKTSGEYNQEMTPKMYASELTMENYQLTFEYHDPQDENAHLGRFFLNTLLFTVVTTGLMMVVIIPAAFAFARLKFKGQHVLFALFLSLMMIPTELVIITNYVTVKGLGLVGGSKTYLGLILPSVTSVFYIYLLKENFEAIPDELYNAARVDGTSDLKYMLKVMVPICQPTIVTIVILKVIECWNSYMWPRLITQNEKSYQLVSNGIQSIRVSAFGRENIPGMMAAVVLVSVPLIVLFLIFREKIMAGVSRGGTKG